MDKGVRNVALVILALILVVSFVPASSKVETLASGLDTVWAIDFLPDGSLIFTERPGRVSVLNGSVRLVGDIPVSERQESGLAGLAVDPEFSSNHFIYVYYTYEDGGGMFNRLSRFTLEGNLSDERILLDGIPSARFHDGGRVRFGPDGLLYVTTGDATDPSSAQDMSSLAGKILRVRPDGGVPEDNPFGTYVYSFGHRNPQGLDWDSRTGELYSVEHGPSRDDELNRIEAGKGYGWPLSCSEQGREGERPVRCFSEFTLAPGSLAIYDGYAYVTGLRSEQLRRLELVGGEVVSEEVVVAGIGRLREARARDGYLFIGTSNLDGRGIPRFGDDRIMRLKI